MLMATGAYEKGHYIYACNEVIYSKKDVLNNIYFFFSYMCATRIYMSFNWNMIYEKYSCRKFVQ